MENVVAREIKSVKQMPGFTNISGFSSFIGYLETDTNKTLLSKWEKATACKKRQRLIAGGAAITVFIILYLYGEKLLYEIVLSLAAFGIASIFTCLAGSREKKARTDYFNDRRNYGIRIADFVSSMLHADYYSFFNGELFIYSNNFCSLIWVDNGNMVTYQKENIIDVNLEHVNIKSKNKALSKTVAGATENVNWNRNGLSFNHFVLIPHAGQCLFANHLKSGITSKTKNDYEWRLDIFSNLPEYPKITLIFREDEQDIARQLKTILEPKKN